MGILAGAADLVPFVMRNNPYVGTTLWAVQAGTILVSGRSLGQNILGDERPASTNGLLGGTVSRITDAILYPVNALMAPFTNNTLGDFITGNTTTVRQEHANEVEANKIIIENKKGLSTLTEKAQEQGKKEGVPRGMAELKTRANVENVQLASTNVDQHATTANVPTQAGGGTYRA